MGRRSKTKGATIGNKPAVIGGIKVDGKDGARASNKKQVPGTLLKKHVAPNLTPGGARMKRVKKMEAMDGAV